MWQGGAYGQGVSQGICSVFSLQPDRTPEGRVSAVAGISTGSTSGICPCRHQSYRELASEGRGTEGTRESLSVDRGGGQRSTRCRGWYVFFHVFILMLRYYAYIMLCVGTFLVNSVPALVLFDSGASRSFVSLAFSQHISVSREALMKRPKNTTQKFHFSI